MNPQYNSASCFACGLENPSGLRLRFCDNGKDQVFTRFTVEAGILAEANILFTDMPANLLNPDDARHIFGWRLYD
jgi:hypothetical protein